MIASGVTTVSTEKRFCTKSRITSLRCVSVSHGLVGGDVHRIQVVCFRVMSFFLRLIVVSRGKGPEGGFVWGTAVVGPGWACLADVSSMCLRLVSATAPNAL